MSDSEQLQISEQDLNSSDEENDAIFDDNLREWQDKIIKDLYNEMEAVVEGQNDKSAEQMDQLKAAMLKVQQIDLSPDIDEIESITDKELSKNDFIQTPVVRQGEAVGRVKKPTRLQKQLRTAQDDESEEEPEEPEERSHS